MPTSFNRMERAITMSGVRKKRDAKRRAAAAQGVAEDALPEGRKYRGEGFDGTSEALFDSQTKKLMEHCIVESPTDRSAEVLIWLMI